VARADFKSMTTTAIDTPFAAGKSAVRAAALAQRSAVTSGRAADIATRLADLGPKLAREHGARVARAHGTTVVAAFWSIGDEIVTLPLIEALDAAGFTVALPITGKRGASLVFRQWKPGDIMARGRMNIPEPLDKAPLVVPDVLFVPLAAFDREGHRIGYGAGFYDRSLAELRASKTIVAIGVGYAAQEVSRVPREAHDEPLDMVLTEHELIVPAAAA